MMSVPLLSPDQDEHLQCQVEKWQDQALANSALLRTAQERGDRLTGDVARLRAETHVLSEDLYEARAEVRRLMADRRAWRRRMVTRFVERMPKWTMVLGAVVGGFVAVVLLRGMGL
jgi:hypothetical protein